MPNTSKKRKKGLLKKVSELTTLCGVEACAVIHSPYDSSPEVWPREAAARSVLGNFANLTQYQQEKKMLNQEKYLKKRIQKTEQHLEKVRKNNRENEMTNVMYECLVGKKTIEGLNLEDTIDVGMMDKKSLMEIIKRIESLEKDAAGDRYIIDLHAMLISLLVKLIID